MFGWLCWMRSFGWAVCGVYICGWLFAASAQVPRVQPPRTVVLSQ